MKATEFEIGKKYTWDGFLKGSYAELDDDGFIYINSEEFGECTLILSETDLHRDIWREFQCSKESQNDQSN